MIGRYDGKYYHVSDEDDDKGNRIIWRYGPCEGLYLGESFLSSSVYEKTVPASQIDEITEFVRFTAKWQGEDVTIEDIKKCSCVRWRGKDFLSVVVEIETYNKEFAGRNEFTPYYIDRGVAICWRKDVLLSNCKDLCLERITPEGDVIIRTMKENEVVKSFSRIVLELRDPPETLSIKKTEIETPQLTKTQRYKLEKARLDKLLQFASLAENSAHAKRRYIEENKKVSEEEERAMAMV